MLSSADSADGPLKIQTVRQWDINGIDVWIVDNLFSIYIISEYSYNETQESNSTLI